MTWNTQAYFTAGAHQATALGRARSWALNILSRLLTPRGQTTSVDPAAFDELLKAYVRIGESLPLLTQYQELFRAKPQMVTILSDMYKEMLKFHHIVLRYFQIPRSHHLHQLGISCAC